jgi:putative intracellular protease/amidase
MVRGTLRCIATCALAAGCAPVARSTPRLAAAAPEVASAAPEVVATAPPRRRNVAILVYPGVELLDFAGPGEVFAANHAFRAYTVGETRAPLVSQGFVTITPEYGIDDAPRPDVLVIPGGHVGSVLERPALQEWVRRTVAADELTMSVCNGALSLASTGALDGLLATTHWGEVAHLHQVAPRVLLAPERRFVDHGHVMTTAGVSAGIDGALHVVQRFAGEESAWKTARYMQYVWSPEDGAVAGRPPLAPARRAAMEAWVMHDWPAAASRYGALAQARPADMHARARLGDALVHLGRLDEGLAEIDRAIAAGQRDPETLTERANALLGARRWRDAARAYQDLGDASEGERPHAYYNRACVLAVAGDRDAAFDALGRAVAAGFTDRVSLERDEDLASLRGDPRFAQLEATAGR